jgi:hypothetical protein
VEGPTLATIHDEPQSRVQVLQDVARSQSQRLETKLGKRGIPSFIALRPVAHIMRFTVNFDGQAAVKAGKVEHVSADRELPSKPQATRPRSKLLPQEHFWQGHLAAELASKANIVRRSADRTMVGSR